MQFLCTLVVPANALGILSSKFLVDEIEMITAPGRCEDQVES